MRRGLLLLLALVMCVTVLLTGASCRAPQEPELGVTPSTGMLVSGQTAQLTVTRRFPGGPLAVVTNQVSYVSSNNNIASVSDKGVVFAGVEAGAAVIHVFDPMSDAIGAVSFTVTLTRIETIELVPSPAVVLRPNTQRQFNAIGHLNNGLMRDITAQVTWASTNASAASVGRTSVDVGIVYAHLEGDTTISATDPTTLVQGRSFVFVRGTTLTLEAIVVTPNPAVLDVGTSLQLSALGVFNDGTTQDVTNAVTWSSNREAIATVTSAGRATGVAAGDVTITAAGTSTVGVGDAGGEAKVRGSAATTVK